MKNHWLSNRMEKLAKAQTNTVVIDCQYSKKELLAQIANTAKEKEIKEKVKRLKFVIAADVCKSVSDYQAGVRLREDLTPIFEAMANNIVCVMGEKYFIDADEIIQECVLVAFDKLDRFFRLSQSNDLAFNYFTTIMLSRMRAVFQRQKRLDKKSAHTSI